MQQLLISVLKRFLFPILIVGALFGCVSAPPPSPPAKPGEAPTVPSIPTIPSPPRTGLPPDATPLGAPIVQVKSRWSPVRWAELPGWGEDQLHEAWNAWLKSCERSTTALASLCPEVRRLSIANANEQMAWMMERLQPYKVEPLAPVTPANGSAGNVDGLLTAYYEPIFVGSRNPSASFSVPMYRPPATLGTRKPWFSRQEMDTLPEARAALHGRAIVYLADPVDALVLQIQGSGRVRVTEPDGSQKTVRIAYAATNDQPYKSVGRWLLDQGAIKDASWPGIKAWIAANPKRVQEMLWSNPRVVFFKEEPLPEQDASLGPKGAQGVALTPGRSIAVDAGSIPYGAPVWLVSNGPQTQLQRLVLAQDTGSAIVGAVRADYFTGWGNEAGELAGRIKQPLKLWVLWPKP